MSRSLSAWWEEGDPVDLSVREQADRDVAAADPLAHEDPGVALTPQIVEAMRVVAVVPAVREHDGAPARKRHLPAMGVAAQRQVERVGRDVLEPDGGVHEQESRPGGAAQG